MSQSDRRADASGTGECAPPPLPFKLRFAPQIQPGRSYVSSIKPMGLPAIVKDKLYRRESDGEAPTDKVQSALSRVRGMFGRGPADKYLEPVTTAHEYGWWGGGPASEAWATSRRLQHHISDSAWMKEQLRVLAADASYKRL